MDPLTHALTSLAVARAGRKWLPRVGVWIVVIAGIAPGLDAASVWGGAGVYLRLHRGLLHGILGAPILACAIAAIACAVARKISAKREAVLLRFFPALAASALGIFVHIVLDYLSGPGVMLLWPFSRRWWGCDVVRSLDPWLLALLVAGILLPDLTSLVSEEIGERRKGPRGRIAAVVTLALVAAYLGYRAELRERAINLLTSSEYHGRAPLAAGAFPLSGSPFVWRGVVSTDNTIEELIVPVGQEDTFDGDRSMTYYKPQESPALDAAENTRAAKEFLAYARFPLATVDASQTGWTVTFRDLRFSPSDFGSEDILAVVEINSVPQIQSSRLRFSSGNSR